MALWGFTLKISRLIIITLLYKLCKFKTTRINPHLWISHGCPRRMWARPNILNLTPVWYSQVWTVMARSMFYDVLVLMNVTLSPCVPKGVSPVFLQHLERRISNQIVPSHLRTVIDLQARICSKRGWWVGLVGCLSYLADSTDHWTLGAKT